MGGATGLTHLLPLWQRPRLWLAALALVVLAACAAPPEELLALGDRPTESDRSSDDRRSQLRLELARSYLAQGQVWVALDEVKQALALNPDAAGAWNLRGIVYAQLGDVQRAQLSFERALALAPRDAEAAHNQAWLICHQMGEVQGRNAQAQADLQRVLAQAGPAQAAHSAPIWLALATCQARAGQAAQALDSLAQPGLQQAQSAQTLWLAAKLARKLDNAERVRQLGGQLLERFGRSPQAAAFDKGAWDE
ncbi:MAG: tetratricopeptide repeat protein [Betaproteobacteria bacterium]